MLKHATENRDIVLVKKHQYSILGITLMTIMIMMVIISKYMIRRLAKTAYEELNNLYEYYSTNVIMAVRQDGRYLKV
jgi:hypothetical protein